MKIVISILVHERKDVVLDQIKNFQFYIDRPIIVLHISKTFYEMEEGCFEELNEFKEVYINPAHYFVEWGNIAHIHISNFQYIKNIVKEFDYFIMHASNDMYVKKGVESYICNYSAGMQRRILRYPKTMWCPCEYAWRDEKLEEIMQKCHAKWRVGTQIEGSFYRKEIFERIIEYIGNSDFWNNEDYTREEIYFSTVAYAIIAEEEIGYPVTFSEVHRYDHGLWVRERLLFSFCNIPFLKGILHNRKYEEIRQYMIEQYKKKAHYAISKKDIRKIRSVEKTIPCRKFMKDYPGEYQLYDGGLYSVKRVPREINHPIRKYIRRKMDEDIMS